MVVQSGKFEAEGRVEFDPNDPKTERIITVHLGHPCRPLPFWRQTWVLGGLVALLGITMILAIRGVAGKKEKNPDRS